MKKFTIMGKMLLAAAFMLTLNNSCTDLTENSYDQLTADNFPKTEEDFIAALGAAYTNFYGIGNHGGFHSVQEVASDEAMIPTRGGDWGDGGQWVNCHRHEFKAGDGNINGTWNFLYSGVSTCNRLIFQFETLKADGKVDPAMADKFTAELRALRALYYYWLIDTFGNVPLVTRFDVPDGFLPSTEPRATVYNYVESELLAVAPLLDKANNKATYGRMTYYTVQFILSKLYLNAGVYTGTPQWAKAAAAADEVINSGLFALESNYRNNFITNNQGSKEFVLAVPYDEVFAGGHNIVQMTLHYGSQATYSLAEQPWNGYCSLQEFYEKHDVSDSRRVNFIVGPQYAADGVTPIVDAGAEPNDPDGPNLNFTPEINEHFPGALRQAGARIGKYEFKSGARASLSNDWPICRYADVLLTKAEAQYRLNGGGDATALALVNQIRVRAGQAPYASLTDQNLLDERGREMFYEGVRRQDMIRFGVFTNAYGFTPAVDASKQLLPIPASQLNVNPNLTQNPGY